MIRLSNGGFWLLLILLAVALASNTAKNAPDFTVYWNTAHLFVTEGAPIYSVARDGMMTFKYPPWILPLFLPLGCLPLAAAKLIWGGVEAMSLVFVALWLKKRVSLGLLSLSLVTWSGIWTVHAFDGQVSLPLTALALALLPVYQHQLRNCATLLLSYALSIKLVTLFPLLGFQWKRGDVRRVACLLVLLTGLSIPAFLAHHQSFSDLMASYRAATGPGIDAAGVVKISVKGSQAQGLVSMLFRLFELDEQQTGLMLALTLALSLVLAVFWRLRSQHLSADQRWAGWLALSATVQPLAGFHSFVLAFPLATLTLHGCVNACQEHDDPSHPTLHKAEKRTLIALSVLGILMIAAFTQKTLGSTTGALLQRLSVKSWGVLLCAMLISTPSLRRPSRPPLQSPSPGAGGGGTTC